MACGQTTPEIQLTLTSSVATLAYAPFTEWIPCIGLDTVTAVLKARGMSNTLHWQLAVQTASVRTDLPDAWATLDVLQTTGAGERCSGSVTVNTAGKFFVRFGVAYKSSVGGTLAQADVALQAAYDACGRVVGGGQAHLVATDTNTRFEPVTGWVPSHQAGKVEAALVATAFGGASFQYRLAQQQAATSPEQPGAWSVLEAGWTTSASERNTGELALSFTNVMWVRFGIAYTLSAGTFGECVVTSLVGVRT